MNEHFLTLVICLSISDSSYVGIVEWVYRFTAWKLF